MQNGDVAGEDGEASDAGGEGGAGVEGDVGVDGVDAATEGGCFCGAALTHLGH